MKTKPQYHWLIVASCCMLAFTSIGLLYNSMGIFYTPIADTLGVGRGNISLFSTIMNITSGLTGPIIVRIINKKNLRKILSLGVSCAAVGLAIVSQAQNVWTFYLVAPFMGIGFASFSAIPLTIIIGNWFHAKQGLALGISYSFSGIGGAIFNPILNGIISAFSWRVGLISMACFIVLFALPGILFVLRLTPEEKGLLPMGETAPVRPAASKGKNANSNTSMKAIIFSLPFLLVTVYALCSNMCPSISSHISGYALTLGFTTAQGATMMSAIMIGNISSKLLIGVISDKIGPIKACSIMFCSVITALALFAFVPFTHFPVVLVVCVFFGAVYSIFAVGFPLVVRRVFGNENYAKVFSTISMITNMLSAFMISIIGFIYDVTGRYQAAFITCMCASIIAFTLLNIIGRMKPHNELAVEKN